MLIIARVPNYGKVNFIENDISIKINHTFLQNVLIDLINFLSFSLHTQVKLN